MKSKNLLSHVRNRAPRTPRRSILTLLAFFALLGAFLTTALPVLAADQVVSDCGDNGGANQLRAKLAAAQSGGGGKITFTCAGPIALGSVLTITSNITIEGGSGIAISGGNLTRIFIVSSGSLTLNNLTVAKGYTSGDGGAIWADAPVTLNNTHFLDNQSTSGAGGAISTFAALNITNSEFSSNSATNGGALFVKWGEGVANITGSNFHDNYADANNALGGAVLLFDGASATVTGSTFMSNTTDYGGAIYVHQPTTNPTTLTMSNSTLSYNRSWESGGAINNSGTMTLTGGTLSWNTGHYAGGISNIGTASLTNVTVSNNYGDIGSGGTYGVGSGGGIGNFENGTLSLTGGTFNNNTAEGDGGAIYNLGKLTASNMTAGSNSGYRGGGIYNRGVTQVNNSTFSSNTSGYGGGIYNEDYHDTDPGSVTLTAVTIDHNTAIAGGGIQNSKGMTLTNVTVSANTATQSGSGGQSGDGMGGGMVNSGVATLLNVTFKGNTSTTGAEAINNAAPGTLTLTNSLVSRGGATHDSCAGNFTVSFSYSDDSSCGFGSGHVVADLKLGALANNGGTTKTHLPAAGSAAIDNGSGLNCPARDQRGITRPQGLACDVGAVEVQPMSATPTATPTVTRTPTATATVTRTPVVTLTPTATATPACGTPAKTVLMAPQKGASTTKVKISLKWKAVPCAQNYQVFVRRDSKNGTVVDSANTTKLSYKTIALSKAHTYFWFVQACNAAAQCSKSAVWKFRVNQ